jgi:hypothetical protein
MDINEHEKLSNFALRHKDVSTDRWETDLWNQYISSTSGIKIQKKPIILIDVYLHSCTETGPK